MKKVIVRVLWLVLPFALLPGTISRVVSAQDSPAASQVKLPPDIHPDSLSRMPRASKDQFTTDEEKAAFDHTAAMSPTVTAKTGVLGPTGTRAQIPELAEAYRTMFGVLTKKNYVDQKYFEEAVLVATRESNNEVEWNDHIVLATKLLGPEIPEIIRNHQEPKGLDEKDALIINYGRELFRQPFNRISSKMFADLEKNFGRQGTLGIALTMGYYTSNALLMHTYDQHTDPARPRPFPDVVPD